MRQVLLVEDEVLVAMELETGLKRAGFSVLGPYFKARDALRAIVELSPDLAVIDINLNGEKSLQVAAALLAAHIPFVTITGYSEHEVPAIYRCSQVMAKPYDMSAIVAALEQLDRPAIGYQL